MTELLRATIFHTPRNPFQENSALEAISDGGLLIESGRVQACGNYAALRDTYPDVRTRDLRGGFLLPGFVDSHVHYPQLRILGGLGYSLFDWLEKYTLPEEVKFAAPDYAESVATEFTHALVSHGTTTALVFGAHFVPATAALFRAAENTGLRVISGLVISDRHLRPELHTTPEAAYYENKQLISCLHGKGKLLYAVTPRFALSSSEPLLEVCRTLLEEHPGVRLQTHINENTAEIAETARLYAWARDYLAVYEQFGLIGPRAVLAHSVHSAASEIERMAAAGCAVAHCPSSNAALGSGIFPMQHHLQAGVRFALGTDVGGGTGMGMLKEALQAYLIQRLAGASGVALSPAHLLYLATRAGAEALGLQGEIGDFTPGKSADFVYLKPPPESPLAAVVRHALSADHLLAAIITLAGAESVRETWISGVPVFRHADTGGN
ncbi:MAG: guanine deaminase [Acidobacteriia bacterium]|nr:guanine deaminase [Terriglobia bacterium]